MTTSQPPVPTSLRCLAVLPAIIMLGGYALLGPKPAEGDAVSVARTAAPAVTTVAANGQEPVVAELPPIGEEIIIAPESADRAAAR